MSIQTCNRLSGTTKAEVLGCSRSSSLGHSSGHVNGPARHLSPEGARIATRLSAPTPKPTVYYSLKALWSCWFLCYLCIEIKTVIVRRDAVWLLSISLSLLLFTMLHTVRSFPQTQVNAVILLRIGRRPLPSTYLPNLYSLIFLPRNALCCTIPMFVIETITNIGIYFQCKTSKTSVCLQELMKCQ